MDHPSLMIWCIVRSTTCSSSPRRRSEARSKGPRLKSNGPSCSHTARPGSSRVTQLNAVYSPGRYRALPAAQRTTVDRDRAFHDGRLLSIRGCKIDEGRLVIGGPELGAGTHTDPGALRCELRHRRDHARAVLVEIEHGHDERNPFVEWWDPILANDRERVDRRQPARGDPLEHSLPAVHAKRPRIVLMLAAGHTPLDPELAAPRTLPELAVLGVRAFFPHK